MANQIKLDPGEKIITEIRRHVFPFIVETIFLGVLVVFPPVLYVGGWWLGFSNLFSGITPFFLFIYFALLLFAWISFFIAWTNYYLDILIVTDQRIIDIEQKRFFHRDVATLSLDKIEDIKVEINGFLATILDYGTLSLQTAAEAREFVVRNIPQPMKNKDKIWDLHITALDKPQHVRVVE